MSVVADPTFATRLHAAVEAHRADRVAEAEQAYRELIAEHPTEPDPPHYLGMLRFQYGEYLDGLRLIERSLELDPTNSHAWNNLGNVLQYLKRDEPSEQAYRRAIELNDSLAAAWYNLARIYVRDRKAEEAIRCLRSVTRVSRGFTQALRVLGELYYRMGDREAASGIYRQWADEAPDDPIPRHMLAANAGGDVPDRADDRYVVKTFDDFADSFDVKLKRLDYSAPQLVAARLMTHRQYLAGTAAVLDAGCGTGWCGPLLRSTARRLVGVDLSPRMLELARERGVYDELCEGELTAYLQSSPASFDIVVAADVLVYFGRLDKVMEAAYRALLPGGLLCFSVEALAAPAAEEDFRLLPHGRYAHSRAYLERVAGIAGFESFDTEEAVLRQELARPVQGFIVACGRAER